jgi:hypothetical protein
LKQIAVKSLVRILRPDSSRLEWSACTQETCGGESPLFLDGGAGPSSLADGIL